MTIGLGLEIGNITCQAYIEWIMYLLQFRYDIDDIILGWHIYLIFVSGLVTSAGGTGIRAFSYQF